VYHPSTQFIGLTELAIKKKKKLPGVEFKPPLICTGE
jgi:hypothetical protein